MNKNEIGINLYEMNKNIMKQEKPLKKAELNDAKNSINKWARKLVGKYAMLLSNEGKDYTIFKLHQMDKMCDCRKKKLESQKPMKIGDECIECLLNRGELLSADLVNNNTAFEFWIKKECGEPVVYYLFDYSAAVINCIV